jgi:hypothetical protein
MIKLLEEVVFNRRLKGLDDNNTIQLSAVFMRAAVESFNEMIGKPLLSQNDEMNEFVIVLLDKPYKIVNRAFRDDTNDNDVEEIIVKMLVDKL